MSVYKRPGTKYYWTKFELNGKRIHKSTKTTNLTKALQWEAALRTQMQRVLVGLERDPMKNTTLREFRQRFLDEIRSLHTDRPDTQDFYERQYDELLAYEGFECPLSEIDEESVDTSSRRAMTSARRSSGNEPRCRSRRSRSSWISMTTIRVTPGRNP